MEQTQAGPLTGLNELAVKWRELKESISIAEANLKELKSIREDISQQMVAIVQGMGEEASEGVKLAGVGTVKLDTKPYPAVEDLGSFLQWALDNNVEAPKLTINATTMAAWYKVQAESSLPIPPEEIVKPFWKTTAKVVKS